MSKKQTICKKCNELRYCDEHHILPEGIFGKGDTEPLCKTCHDEYHRFLGFKFTRKKNAQSRQFYILSWEKWITTLMILGIIYLICF